MCCPKGKCGCQYFILLTLKKKKSWTISEQSKILFEQEQYYRKLYSFNHLCVDNEFFFQHDVKLSDEQKNSPASDFLIPPFSDSKMPE
jgi:hypothetical protein